MLSKCPSNTIAFILLGLMFLLMLFSALGDSATYDEHAHIPSGYSYLTLKDYRLNPEHPPLIKDLSALPLLFLSLKFPVEAPSWTGLTNGEWNLGRIFIYESGNDADKVIFWARFPIILLALFFGWFLFNTARNLYGNNVGLAALFFFVTSPTIIAHSRYVTTDIGAAFGFFLGLVTFYKFLKNKDIKSLIFAGICLGIALLIKFSTFLLVPLYILFGLLWVFLAYFDHLRSLASFKSRVAHLIKEEGKMALRLISIFIVAFSLVLIVYQYHVWNYPPERQVKDTQNSLPSFDKMPMNELKEITKKIKGFESFGIKKLPGLEKITNDIRIHDSFGIKPLVEADIWLADKPVLRCLGQYLLGLLMSRLRFGFATSGNPIYYYCGEISGTGWKSYFPLAYLLKEQLAFHILTLFVLITAIGSFLKKREKSLIPFIQWLRDNFVLAMSFIFIGIYWVMSILSPLNIGVRHVLPTLPFIYLLVAYYLDGWLKTHNHPVPQNYRKGLYSLYERSVKPISKYFFLGVILFWLLIEIVLVYPSYLSYYNILAGGPAHGWKFIVDSNYDWGQDLKRLKKFVTENNVEKIKLDCFGSGGNAAPYYYLGEKYEPWHPSKGKPQGWFAISATQRQIAFGKPVKGLQTKPNYSYSWLKQYEPVARAGQSIFIYNIE
jgi:4-amino-4-deoxy-L-arabinose transferase-like glycosyltransferase